MDYQWASCPTPSCDATWAQGQVGHDQLVKYAMAGGR